METGLEGEGDGQMPCLWAYLVDLAHSYNFLSARQSPARPAQESGVELSPIYLSKHAASTWLCAHQSHSCGGGSLHSPRNTISGVGRLLHNAHSPQEINLHS